ncbi:MAG: serine/threonine protein kinase [Myxococcales bacterium]|nr:serine/threonine protein kinase [Myxococcales bacterium]
MKFGRYELLERISAGGMAEVFRATSRAEGSEKLLAIKRMLPVLSEDPKFVEMFIAEARLTAGLTHGNIAQVFDFGLADGCYFLAMELVEGLDLRQVLMHLEKISERIPVALVLHVALHTAEALAYAHERRNDVGERLGLVHRDVSPQNILLGFDGEVKLVDFGIAKVRLRATNTTQGRIKGKCAYMAPEQVRSQAVDPRTDIWGLGVVLHEMLCGRPLFLAASQASTLQRVLHARVPRPSLVNPNCPAELDEIVLRCLSRDATERYTDGAELASSIGNLVVQRGLALHSSDVAQWMRAHFPKEEEATRTRQEGVHTASEPARGGAAAALDARGHHNIREDETSDLPGEGGSKTGITYVERVVAGRMHGLLQSPDVRAPEPEPMLDGDELEESDVHSLPHSPLSRLARVADLADAARQRQGETRETRAKDLQHLAAMSASVPDPQTSGGGSARAPSLTQRKTRTAAPKRGGAAAPSSAEDAPPTVEVGHMSVEPAFDVGGDDGLQSKRSSWLADLLGGQGKDDEPPPLPADAEEDDEEEDSEARTFVASGTGAGAASAAAAALHDDFEGTATALDPVPAHQVKRPRRRGDNEPTAVARNSVLAATAREMMRVPDPASHAPIVEEDDAPTDLDANKRESSITGLAVGDDYAFEEDIPTRQADVAAVAAQLDAMQAEHKGFDDDDDDDELEERTRATFSMLDDDYDAVRGESITDPLPEFVVAVPTTETPQALDGVALTAVPSDFTAAVGAGSIQTPPMPYSLPGSGAPPVHAQPAPLPLPPPGSRPITAAYDTLDDELVDDGSMRATFRPGAVMLGERHGQRDTEHEDEPRIDTQRGLMPPQTNPARPIIPVGSSSAGPQVSGLDDTDSQDAFDDRQLEQLMPSGGMQAPPPRTPADGLPERSLRYVNSAMTPRDYPPGSSAPVMPALRDRDREVTNPRYGSKPPATARSRPGVSSSAANVAALALASLPSSATGPTRGGAAAAAHRLPTVDDEETTSVLEETPTPATHIGPHPTDLGADPAAAAAAPAPMAANRAGRTGPLVPSPSGEYEEDAETILQPRRTPSGAVVVTPVETERGEELTTQVEGSSGSGVRKGKSKSKSKSRSKSRSRGAARAGEARELDSDSGGSHDEHADPQSMMTESIISPPARSAWRWLSLLLILIMFAAAGVGAYLLYEKRERDKARVAPSKKKGKGKSSGAKSAGK